MGANALETPRLAAPRSSAEDIFMLERSTGCICLVLIYVRDQEERNPDERKR
jgi:hypothetical protein